MLRRACGLGCWDSEPYRSSAVRRLIGSFAPIWRSGCRELRPTGWPGGLPARAPRHTGRREYAPAYRPRSTARNSCAPCSWAGNPWAGAARGSQLQHVKQPADHCPDVDLARTAAAFGRRDQQSKDCQFAIRQIARISQRRSVITRSALLLPHVVPPSNLKHHI